MEMKKGTRVTIEIYDADGEYCESFSGRLGYEEIRERMIDALKNDGIPVIRHRGKHETVEEDNGFLNDAMREKMKEMSWIVNEVMKQKQHVHVMNDSIVPLPMRMMLDYEFDGIKFHAAGNAEDVHKANEALLKRVFEE